MRDEGMRTACFAELRRRLAVHGPDIPCRGGLDGGFVYGGHISFITPYKGIFRSRRQEGPAALSINTSTRYPYRDRATADGSIYSHRAGDVHQPDKIAREVRRDTGQGDRSRRWS